MNKRHACLIGASEVVNGSRPCLIPRSIKECKAENKGMHPVKHPKDRSRYWRQRLPLSLSGVAASGTLPSLREAEHIKADGHYWDGLYSQNPPVREFFEPPAPECQGLRARPQ